MLLDLCLWQYYLCIVKYFLSTQIISLFILLDNDTNGIFTAIHSYDTFFLSFEFIERFFMDFHNICHFLILHVFLDCIRVDNLTYFHSFMVYFELSQRTVRAGKKLRSRRLNEMCDGKVRMSSCLIPVCIDFFST